MIVDPDPTNDLKNSFFPMLGFDEEKFPFFVVLGSAGVNIANIKNLKMKRLMNQNLTLFCGVRPAFMIRDKRGMALHLAANVVDNDGSCGTMRQWLKFEMRHDVLSWL